MRLSIVLSIVLAGCSTVPQEGPDARSGRVSGGATDVAKSDRTIPRAARVEQSGYLTILETPPTAFPDSPPPMPTALDSFARRTSLGSAAERDRAWDEANGDAAFQREFQRLRGVIERGEPQNFVSVRLVRDPGVIGEFVFSRDGAQTLAQYTDDPAFRAVDTGVDPVAFAALEETWRERAMNRKAAINLMGANPTEGRIELGVGVEEADFRSFARRKGWDLADPRLDFTFAQPRPDPYTSPELARFVRSFPRENEAASIRLLAKGTGRVVLDDGCFRLANDRGRPSDTLVMFARGSQLTLDTEGYLAIRTGDEGRLYRIGELGSWGGPNGFSEGDEDVRALRRACGGDAIINIAAPESEQLFATPEALWVLDYAYTKDIAYEEAWDRVIACMTRQIDRGRQPMEARDRCIKQYNAWDYTGEELPPPPGQ